MPDQKPWATSCFKSPGYREQTEVHRTEAAFEGRPARECQNLNPNLNPEKRRRGTRCACPQVPHPTLPPPVLRNVREPRPEAATRIPESARWWGADQLSLIRPSPNREEPGLGRPPFLPRGRPARRTRFLAVPGSNNGRDQVVEEPGQDGKDLVQFIWSRGERRGLFNPFPGSGVGVGRLQLRLRLL